MLKARIECHFFDLACVLEPCIVAVHIQIHTPDLRAPFQEGKQGHMGRSAKRACIRSISSRPFPARLREERLWAPQTQRHGGCLFDGEADKSMCFVAAVGVFFIGRNEYRAYRQTLPCRVHPYRQTHRPGYMSRCRPAPFSYGALVENAELCAAFDHGCADPLLQIGHIRSRTFLLPGQIAAVRLPCLPCRSVILIGPGRGEYCIADPARAFTASTRPYPRISMR